MKRIRLDQAGDTLVEVAMAIAILGLTMTLSFGGAVRAYNLGQTARERTQIAELAQQQMEALKNFRDARTWKEFIDGGTVGGAAYPGIRSVLNATCDRIGRNCFHMELKTVGGVPMWIPEASSIVYNGTNYQDGITPKPTVAASQNYVGITLKDLNLADLDTADSIDFRTFYALNSRGAEDTTGEYNNRNDIYARLANLDAAPKPTKFATVPDCSAQPIDVVLVIDRSGSMQGAWDPGHSRIAEVKEVTKAFVKVASNNLRIGIVSFSNNGRRESDMSPDPGTLQAAIDGINTDGGTFYAPGLQEAETVFARSPKPTARKVIVFMSDGENNDADATKVVSTEMKARGIIINSINMTIGSQNDTRSLDDMASPGRFKTALTEDDFERIMTNIRDEYTCDTSLTVSPLLGP